MKNLSPKMYFSNPNLKTCLRACVYCVIDQALAVTPAQDRPDLLFCFVDILFYYLLIRTSSTNFLSTQTLFKNLVLQKS